MAHPPMLVPNAGRVQPSQPILTVGEAGARALARVEATIGLEPAARMKTEHASTSPFASGDDDARSFGRSRTNPFRPGQLPLF
jgi:hypothetical protein